MPITEDTINTWLRQYLKAQGLNIEAFVSAKLPSGASRLPDFEIRNSGVFYGEGEWRSNEGKGWAQAHDYSTVVGSSGSFLILYPDELREAAIQTRPAGREQEILSRFKYRVAFLRTGCATDMATLSLQELRTWIEDNIHRRREPVVFPSPPIPIRMSPPSALAKDDISLARTDAGGVLLLNSRVGPSPWAITSLRTSSSARSWRDRILIMSKPHACFQRAFITLTLCKPFSWLFMHIESSSFSLHYDNWNKMAIGLQRA